MSLKKWLIGGGMAGAVAAASLLGRLVLPSLAQGPTATPQDLVETPSYTSSISVDQAVLEGVSETDEAIALQSQATITAEKATAAALAANPGSAVVKVELDNENGALVYSVELDNGSDVKVDAGNGSVLSSDQDQDSTDTEVSASASDTDNVQEEVQDGPQDGPADTPEVAGSED
jgi:hypothetical protein